MFNIHPLAVAQVQVQAVSDHELETAKTLLMKDPYKAIENKIYAAKVILSTLENLVLVFWENGQGEKYIGIDSSIKFAIDNASRLVIHDGSRCTFNLKGRDVEAQVWMEADKPYFKFVYNCVTYTNDEPHKHKFEGFDVGHSEKSFPLALVI